MDSISILIDYFNKFEEVEKDTSKLKKIKNVINILKNAKEKNGKVEQLRDFDFYVDITNDSIKKNVDVVLYDILYSIISFNNSISNKMVRRDKVSLKQDISFSNINIELKDILNYLDIKDGDIDNNLLDDLSKYADLDNIKKFSIAIKTDNGLRRVLYDKIEDKNILVSILLHSNLEIVDSIVDIFNNENANLNKVVNNIPSIFIKDLVSSKCKYNNVETNYDNFINNYKLLKENDIDFKKVLNQSVFLVNDYNKNEELFKKLDTVGLKKIIIEGIGGIYVSNPTIVDNNIKYLENNNMLGEIDKNTVTLLTNPDLVSLISNFGSLYEIKQDIINNNRRACKNNNVLVK